jgi:hypothetical protein
MTDEIKPEIAGDVNADDDETIIHVIDWQNGVTVLPTAFCQDHKINAVTRSVLMDLLSRPKNWRISVSGVMKINGIGRDAARAALRDAAEAGYAFEQRAARSGGKFGVARWLICADKRVLSDRRKSVKNSQLSPGPEKPAPVHQSLVNNPLQTKETKVVVEELREIQPNCAEMRISASPTLEENTPSAGKAKTASPKMGSQCIAETLPAFVTSSDVEALRRAWTGWAPYGREIAVDKAAELIAHACAGCADLADMLPLALAKTLGTVAGKAGRGHQQDGFPAYFMNTLRGTAQEMAEAREISIARVVEAELLEADTARIRRDTEADMAAMRRSAMAATINVKAQSASSRKKAAALNPREAKTACDLAVKRLRADYGRDDTIGNAEAIEDVILPLMQRHSGSKTYLYEQRVDYAYELSRYIKDFDGDMCHDLLEGLGYFTWGIGELPTRDQFVDAVKRVAIAHRKTSDTK